MNISYNDEKVTNHPVLQNANEIQPNSSSNDEPGVITLKNDWSCLNSLVLEQIYSLLNKTDQFSMSLVCKNWLKEYESPNLWRHFTFYLPEYVCCCDSCPGTKFPPQKFMRFFKHVEIVCKRVRSNLINDIFVQLDDFLDFITNTCRLRSIRFIDMNKYFRQLEYNYYELLFQGTIEFFKKQTCLELMEFRNSSFLREEGAKILTMAFENNASTLETVIIRGFDTNSVENDEIQIDDFELYRLLKRHIMNLKTLRADYTQLLENIIMARCDGSRQVHKLSLLEIVCDGSKRLRFQGITPQAFQCLCRLCPNLKVQMILTSPSHPRSDYTFYIVKHMPIQLLEYHVPTHLDSRDVDIGELLQHLVDCGCNHHLESLAIIWMPRVEDISIPFIPFLQAARKLRRLYIYVRCPVSGFKDLFISWLIRRPSSLEIVYISVAQCDSEAYFQSLVRLAVEFSPVLNILGLKVNLIAHPI